MSEQLQSDGAGLVPIYPGRDAGDEPAVFPLPRDTLMDFVTGEAGNETIAVGWTSREFVVQRYQKMRDKTLFRAPRTPAGWSQTWALLVSEYPAVARLVEEKVRRWSEVQTDRRQAAKVVATQVAERELALRKSSFVVSLAGLTLLGGYGFGEAIVVGTEYDAEFTDAGFVISRRHSPVPILAFDLAGLAEMDFSGPGAVRTGGGFVGGGFGLSGAAAGIIAAGVLNSLTSRTRIHTVLRCRFSQSELFFFCSTHTPGQLRILLSPVLALMTRLASPAAPPAVPAPVDDGVLGRLERLSLLRENGSLTDEEFQTLKQQIISG